MQRVAQPSFVPQRAPAVNLARDGGPLAITIVSVILNPRAGGPGFLPPGAEVFLDWEQREAAETARAHGWRDRTRS
jgi:hypothetical protein